MSKATTYFTSESVSEGHPDKVADQISDAIVSFVLKHDKKARVAVETMVKDNTVVLGGELSTSVDVPFDKLVRETILAIGYDDEARFGFDGHTCQIVNLVGMQSPDIAMGVDQANDVLGAGDQGIMFGIACDETETRAPLAITMAHHLLRNMAKARKEQYSDLLGPDVKSQITLRYVDGEVAGVDAVVVSTQHVEGWDQADLRQFVIREFIKPLLEEYGFGGQELVDVVSNPRKVLAAGNHDESIVKVYVNPTGKFVIGGPVGDCGLTGRKIIVDTTGGYGRHGGGAKSGKDCSKVDRSAAYAARHAARNVVAAGLARKVEIQLSYAIGYPHPTSILVDTFGSIQANVTEEQIAQAVAKVFDFSPAGIIRDLKLLEQDGWSYLDTAAYGHFGRDDLPFPWEQEDKVEALIQALFEIQEATKAA